MTIIKARLSFERLQRSKQAKKPSTRSRSKPYLSIVITGRNDGYGSDFLGRLQMFMRSLDHQVRDYENLIELIIVEWNPPQDRPPMRAVIHEPENYTVRIITVSNEIHESMGSEYPLLEFYAKNTGARRAQGEFVLLTNPDIIFSQEMIDEFGRRDLDTNCFYRTDRFDFNGEGIREVPLDDLISWICPRVFVGHITDQSISVTVKILPEHKPNNVRELPRSIWTEQTVHSNGAGDYILASRSAFDEVGGVIETTKQRWHIDAYSCVRFYRAGFDPVVFAAPLCIFHTDHPRGGMDQDIQQHSMEEFVLAPTNRDWGLRGIDLPEWRFSR